MTRHGGCNKVAELLAEVAAGTASGPDRVRVSWHVAGCDTCLHELDELGHIADELRSTLLHRRSWGGER